MIAGKLRFTKRTFEKSQMYTKDFWGKSDLQKGLWEIMSLQNYLKDTVFSIDFKDFQESQIYKKDF